MNRRLITDSAKDSQKMLYATTLREAMGRRDAEGVVTGIAANAPEAANPAPVEPEPLSQEVEKWKQ
eukprot:8283566-Prorocentrum_lima.AAC.1